MKEELCVKVVEVRRKSDRVIAIVLVFEKEVLRVIYAYALKVGRPECEKDQFYDMASEWDFQNPNKMVLGPGDFNGHVGRRIDGFEMCMVEMELAKEMLKEDDYSSFAMKRG